MPQDKIQSRILLGEITGAHGIRGDVLVRSYTAAPESIASYGPLSNAAASKHYTLKVVRVTDKGIIARISGINDRNGAEALRGTELYIERSRLPAASAAEYYHADLIGLRALAPDGTEIGSIVGVHNFGAGDLIEFKPTGGTSTEFVPFEDKWVPNVDIAAGTIAIMLPPARDEEADPGESDPDEDDGSP